MTAKRSKVANPATLPIDRTDFEEFFKIDSLGYLVAKEAFRQGVIGTPYEMVETVCAANKSIGRKLLDRVTVAVPEIDLIADPEYVENARALNDLVIATFGESGFDQILKELVIEVAQELHVSLRPSRRRMYEKYKLWSDVLKSQPN